MNINTRAIDINLMIATQTDAKGWLGKVSVFPPDRHQVNCVEFTKSNQDSRKPSARPSGPRTKKRTNNKTPATKFELGIVFVSKAMCSGRLEETERRRKDFMQFSALVLSQG